MLSIERILLLVLVAAAVLGCGRPAPRMGAGFTLEPGDLLFQDSDCGPMCDAIEKVTTGYRGANFSHVGIAAANPAGDIVVIEAVSAGVKVTELDAFLERSSDANGRSKVIVGRLKKQYRRLIPRALEEASALKGRPYDKVFAVDNDAYYCSELVYEVFKRANKDVPVFALQPMTFKDPDTGAIMPVWKEYYEKLGVAVPQGEPGINPGGISRSDVLTIVHRYGVPSTRGG